MGIFLLRSGGVDINNSFVRSCLHPASPTLFGFRHVDHIYTVMLFLSGWLLSISSQDVDHLAWFQALVSFLVSFLKCLSVISF